LLCCSQKFEWLQVCLSHINKESLSPMGMAL